MAQRKERRSGDVTPEVRAAAVRRVLESGKPVTVVAKELGLNDRTLWAWVDKARLKQIDPAGELPVEAR
jgi:transposase-like protein